MIFDYLQYGRMYAGLTKHMHHAFTFLNRSDLAALAVGRYDLAGEDAFALVQAYETKPPEQGKWEAHRKYIDVQFVATGAERMGYATLDAMTPSQPYDEIKDVVFFTGSGADVILTPGTFMILAPHDVHRPVGFVDRPASVRKVVVKIHVD